MAGPTPAASVPGPALVIGLGQAGVVTARELRRRGVEVVAIEDQPGERARQVATELGLTLVEAPSGEEAVALLDTVAVVVPSPAVCPTHPVLVAAVDRGVPVWSEFELAARWGLPPVVAITGTNGKTTVTTLVADMVTAAGRRTAAAGNNDVPLVAVLDDGLDLVVVEASSFRLEFTETFRPDVALWLNLAEDHLDWHPDMEHYAHSKARIWASQRPEDVAIVNADDPVVMAAASGAPGRVVTFGVGQTDYRVVDGALVLPDGSVLVVGHELFRALPHDLTNALAAAACALEAGIPRQAVRDALLAFRGLPHRLALVADDGGVRFYDDSKATDPHATAAAIAGFDSVVLLAGGRNKGLDLSVLADSADRLRHVVAIGEAAAEVTTAFAGTGVEVTTATSMDDAVDVARAVARPGDAVVLSPGCASFDWYGGYGERGDDFARAVHEQRGSRR
ncbi:MAG TPA: UDP-N-acetylmuramoyl-L-alanine--D-glutamate ligase [Acidimicrobiales bacterium]|nr:UDP-N-acetylmuramoyl-L-alanine--D-glutamate ligase [Acidimicrobiales bacterium]